MTSKTVHDTILRLYMERFDAMRAEAAGMDPPTRKKYLKGARKAYWNAIEDLVAAGVLHIPEPKVEHTILG